MTRRPLTSPGDSKLDICEDDMETDWPARAKGLLKAELKRKA